MAPRVAIIGGGFTGASVAVHLSRRARGPLDIAVVEPAAELGRGVAYGTTDPDHRINGPTLTHSLYPDDAQHFDRWYCASGALEADPECRDAVGRAFVRRADMGSYVGAELARHQRDNPSGSAIRHVRDRAVDVVRAGEAFTVELAGGDRLAAGLLVITTSNAPPAVPPPLEDIAAAGHPAFCPDPWDLPRLAAIPADARVLVVGTGLTMADVAVTVLRDRPAATIAAVSRRGLLPKSQRAKPAAESIPDTMARAEPDFVQRHGRPATVVALLRALRQDIRDFAAKGVEWQVAFDDLRDAAHQIWPLLPLAEQSRFLRHLSPWYETHRFRYPPQTDAKVRALIADGRLAPRAAAIVEAAPRDGRIEVATRPRGQDEVTRELFDAVINCTGPDRRPDRAGDPFLHNLVAGGLLAHHPLGLGLEVDEMCRAQNRDGRHDGRVRVIGPLSRGRLGETNGVPHTGYHIARVLPDMLAELDRVGAAEAVRR